jgi:hypothetical protein
MRLVDALNDNCVRPALGYGRKRAAEFLIGSSHRNWLNLNTLYTRWKLNLVKK